MTSNKTIHKQPSKRDSYTEVNTVFSGPRVVFGVRVNKKLKEQFVEVAKREFGSVCRPLEAFMAAVLAVTPLKVNSSKTINIEKIVIERNLRPRRYAHSDISSDDAEAVEDHGSRSSCGMCERPSVVVAFLSTFSFNVSTRILLQGALAAA
jgi:hypothetical protein